MSQWSKTLFGNQIPIERAFGPFQHVMVRLGYELTDVRPGRRLDFKKRTDSSLAWDNHRRAHSATLKFKEKTRGLFAKEQYLEIEIIFDDWDMMVSDAAARAWQEVADKLQVMLSDPATFLPLAPPAPAQGFAPWVAPVQAPAPYWPIAQYQPAPTSSLPLGLVVGMAVWVRWSDGQSYAATIAFADSSQATVVFVDGGQQCLVPLTSLLPRDPAPQAAPTPAPAVHHVIERQIVVTRCRFCAQITPVDRASCQHCGAASFS